MNNTARFDRNFFIQLGIAAVLVAVAVGWRVFNRDTMTLPNLEFITGATLVAGVMLHRYYAVLVPLFAMFISDIMIGAVGVSVFVWTAFLVIGLAGLALRRFKGQDTKLIATTAGVGLGAAVFFFLWTNFGVWLLGDGTFYSKDLAGLIECYVMGIPFFRGTLISGLIIAPAMMAVAIYLPGWVKALQGQVAAATKA